MVADALQWSATFGLGVLFVFFAGGNAWTLARAWWKGYPTALVLFVGGVSGALAVSLAPVPGLARWLWLPVLLDVGSLRPLSRMLLHGLRRLEQFHRPDDQYKRPMW